MPTDEQAGKPDHAAIVWLKRISVIFVLVFPVALFLFLQRGENVYAGLPYYNANGMEVDSGSAHIHTAQNLLSPWPVPVGAMHITLVLDSATLAQPAFNREYRELQNKLQPAHEATGDVKILACVPKADSAAMALLQGATQAGELVSIIEISLADVLQAYAVPDTLAGAVILSDSRNRVRGLYKILNNGTGKVVDEETRVLRVEQRK